HRGQLAPPAFDRRKLRLARNDRAGKQAVDEIEREHARSSGGGPLTTRRYSAGSAARVPRTRSSHCNCRESCCELRVQSGARIIELLVSYDSEVRYGARGKLMRTSESGH